MNNKQLLVNLITNSMDRFSTTHINVAHLSLQANKAFLKADHNNYEELAIQLTTYANNNLI